MTPVAAVDAGIDAQVRHLIARYSWALDTGDVVLLETLFTPDCVLQDTSGARHEGRVAAMAYFTWLVRLPAFRGRRHHIDNLLYLDCGERCRIKAYWMVEKWEAASGTKAIDFAGHSEDLIVLQDGAWRFAERVLHYWRDSDGPWSDGAPGA